MLSCAPVMLSHVPEARAQDESYRQLAEEAARAIAERRLPEALTLFRELHAMAPSARTLWSLGRVHYELGEYVVALDYLEQALVDPRRPLEGEPRAEASSLRDRALALIGQVEVHVRPEGATVLLDDVVVREPMLRLDPGEHVVRFELAGHQPAVRRVVVRGGERETLSLDLVPVGSASASPGAALVQQPRDITVEVRSASPALRLHLQPLSTSGTIGPVGPMEALCAPPCEQTVRSGLYGGAVSRDESAPVSAVGNLELLSDTILEIDYHDESNTRLIGGIVISSMLVLGLAGTIAGAIFLGDQDTFDGGWGTAMLATGIPLLALGLPGLAFVFSPDFTEIRAVPR